MYIHGSRVRRGIPTDLICCRTDEAEKPDVGQSAEGKPRPAVPPQTAGGSADVQVRAPDNSNSTDSDTASARKWQFCRQLSRSKETSCSRAVEDLTDHQIFVSISGNQFRRNGMGDFGTFFY